MNWLKNLSVAHKIKVLVVQAIVGIALVGGISFWATRTLSDATEAIGRQQLPAVRNMTLCDMMHDGMLAVVYRSIVASEQNDAEAMAGAVQEADEFAANFYRYFGALDELELQPHTRQAVADAAGHVSEYVEGAKSLVALCQQGRRAEALAGIPGVQAVYDRLEESLGALGELVEADADASVEQAQSFASVANRSVLTALILGAGGALLLGMFLARRIVTPLEASVEVLESGQLERLASIDSGDEFGRMAKAVAQTLGAAREGAAQLAQQKQQLEDNAAQLEAAMNEARSAAERSEQLAREAARVASMVENSTACMMYADESLTLRYLNPAAREALTLLAAAGRAGFDVRDGKPLSAFYENPAGNAEFFANPSNLPFQTRLDVGEETVDVSFRTIYDSQRRRMGVLISFEVVSERLRVEQRAQAAAAEAARVASMVENAPACMMYADARLVLRYINPAAKQALARLELDGERLIGRELAEFFRHPQGNAQFFGDPRHLPWTTQFQRQGEELRLTASAVPGADGERMGLLVSWEIVTEHLRAERSAKEAAERELRQAHELQTKVEQLLAAVDAASRGDLTRAIDVGGDDAVGRMGAAVGRLLEDFRRSMARIRDNAQKLATASEQLTAVSERMSSEAEQTSSQVNVVASAASKVDGSMRNVSANTDAMTESIVEISRSASSAARVARTAVDTAEQTHQTVSALDRSSEEIGKILKTITAIAQQTNLLALNATIEAARAGEMGKGFAVVANEVKELAKETARATTDIGAKIEAIQSGSRGAVQAIGKIGGIIKEIDGLQTTIAAAVEQQSATTKDITSTLNNAAQASTEITANMSQVATAARETSSGATNTLGVASEVARMADEMLELVGHFRC